jgi:hypothetical protein
MGLVNLTPNDEAEVYSGRNAAINISFYIIQPKQGVASGKRGFGLNFNAVMLLDGGDRLGGSYTPADANAIFGGFVQDMGPTTQAPVNNNVQHQQAANPSWDNNAVAQNNNGPFGGNTGGFI